ncbi:MAG: HD domain-containing protein [Planctomycetaceae bacterium]|nr:HD domain-containing protein [Planctomycetaceae bacterium]
MMKDVSAQQSVMESLDQDLQALRGLLAAGAKLYVSCDRHEMMETILRQARAMTRAEGGSLLLAGAGTLRFVAVQNDVIDTREIARCLLQQEMPISCQSVGGFVATTGRILNIPDTSRLDAGSPFHINRDFDARTGYRTQSMLAIPLQCPDGSCAGVLELINHRDDRGDVAPFPASLNAGVLALASVAAVTVSNEVLQERLRQAHLNTILRLSTVAEFRDDDTGSHIRRVSAVSEIIARAMGLDAAGVALIKYASPMHDVGKVAIPDAILLKPDYLTTDQRQIMQRHTVIGAQILSEPQDEVLSMARDIALCHHERWDGKGYPGGLAAEAIPLAARIVALADVFDAIVNRRCYKAACSLDTALEIVRGDTGRHFAPDVTAAFLASLDETLASYPLLAKSAN